MYGHSSPEHRRESTTALFSYINAKDQESFNLLISHARADDIDFKQTQNFEGFDFTVLHLAARQKMWRAVETMMLHIDASRTLISDEDTLQFGAVVVLASLAGRDTTVKLLLSSRLAQLSEKSIIMDWEFIEKPKDNVLHSVIRKNYSVVLDHLLAYGYSLDKANLEETPLQLAIRLDQLDCLEVIAKYRLLPPTCFATASPQRLLRMMSLGIPLANEGYQHEVLQRKRASVLNLLVDGVDFAALSIAKDKNSLLAKFLFTFDRGFFGNLLNLNPESSPETFRKSIEGAYEKAKTKRRPTTFYVLSGFKLDGQSRDRIPELQTQPLAPPSVVVIDDPNTEFQDVSLEDSVSGSSSPAMSLKK